METLSDILDQVTASGDRAPVTIPPGWRQGRATFGGLVVALGLKAMIVQVEPERRPRALQAAFVGPVAAGPVEVAAKVLRRGRAATQVEAEVLQEGQVVCSALGSFGADRPSGLAVAGPALPGLPLPDHLPELPYLPGVTPEFTQRFAYRFAVGELPYSGSPSRSMGGFCRLREPAREAAPEHVVVLVDAWPAPLVPMLPRPAPSSSLTWSLELVTPTAGASTADWWPFLAEVDHAAGGYGHVRGTLWTPDGRLAALSRQTVVVFD
jgi:acyl-CoA thioesterase